MAEILDSVLKDKIVACLYRDRTFCMSAAEYLKPSYFSESPVEQNLVKIGIDYWRKFKSTCSDYAFTESIKYLIESKKVKEDEIRIYAEYYGKIKKLDISDSAFVAETIVSFVKKQEYRKAIEDAVTKFLPKGNFEELEKEMKRIASISTFSENDPYQYFGDEEIEARMERRAKSLLGIEVGIPTGIKRIDEILPNNGFFKKELYNFMGGPKTGKSMALSFFSNIAAFTGHTVAYFSGETSIEVLTDRMDAMNADIETKKIVSRHKEAYTHMLASRPERGDLFFYEYPTKRLTNIEIERQINRLQNKIGRKVDMIVSDYAGTMRPDVMYGDKLAEEASIYEGLRALASIFDCPVLTASQINRGGSGKAIVTGADKAGTYEAIMVADYNISFSASAEDLRKGQLTIHFAECRNVERRTLKITTGYETGRFYKKFLEEVE